MRVARAAEWHLRAGGGRGEHGLFDQAVALVAREGKASTSFIQRHLQIGYNRAAKLIEQMEKEGVVSAANHVGKREVLVRRRRGLKPMTGGLGGTARSPHSLLLKIAADQGVKLNTVP